MLIEWDPLGVYRDEPRPDGDDEYDDLIWPILRWLDNGVDAEDLSTRIVAALRHHYGLAPRHDLSEIEFSRQLVSWWGTAN